MPYVPNAVDTTQPTEDKFVESAALEFRTLKARVAEVAALVGSGGGGSSGVASFNTRTGAVTLTAADTLTALKAGADANARCNAGKRPIDYVVYKTYLEENADFKVLRAASN